MSDLDDMRSKLAWWSESAPVRARAGEVPPESAVIGRVVARAESSRVAVEFTTEQVNQLALQLAPLLRAPAPAWTFGQVAVEWLKDIRPRRVAPANESRAIARLACFSNDTENTLLAGRVEEALERLKLHGRLAGASINKIRSAGRLAIDFAAARGWWTKPNPFALAKRQKEQRKPAAMLTLDELARIQAKLRPDRRRQFRVALHLGLRTGELFALRKEDIDFMKGVVKVRRSHGRVTTKTGKEREVPLLPAVAGDLLEAVQASTSELVFGNADGTRQRQDTKLTRVLRTAMVAANVRIESTRYHCRKCRTHFADQGGPTARECAVCSMRLWPVPQPMAVRWYDLRHMCATLHHHHGADELCISLALGHSVKGTTRAVYTHPSPAKMIAELSRWNLPR